MPKATFIESAIYLLLKLGRVLLTSEKSDSLGPKLGVRAFMGLFGGTRM